MKRAPKEHAPFGRYLLIEQLAQGGVARIWRARAAGASPGATDLVVKTLQPQLVGQPLFAELFAAEVRVTPLLSHPGIVRVFDGGVVKRVPFVAMERVDGHDLGALFRAMPAGRRFSLDAALSIGLEMSRALGYAHLWRDGRGHQRAIVHGDLSPSNVMIRKDGGVTLIDFGVAHMNPRVAQGRAHFVVGKTGYLAPELLDDAVADARSDVFSAGVILYELLAGRPLFAVDDNERETLRRLTEAPVAPPSRANPNVGRALDDIVLRALSRHPAERFANAYELAAALERLQAPGLAVRRRVADLVKAPPPPAEAAWGGSTATIHRRLQRPAPARPRARVARAHGGRFGRALLALSVLVAALLAPMSKGEARRWVSAALAALDQGISRLDAISLVDTFRSRSP